MTACLEMLHMGVKLRIYVAKGPPEVWLRLYVKPARNIDSFDFLSQDLFNIVRNFVTDEASF